METMTRPQAIEFLAVGTRTGRLATASPDGASHVAPVWFVVADFGRRNAGPTALLCRLRIERITGHSGVAE
ncbi:hypothetical protein GCM10022221_39650 [Actinocorallia aurea]